MSFARNQLKLSASTWRFHDAANWEAVVLFEHEVRWLNGIEALKVNIYGGLVGVLLFSAYPPSSFEP